MVSDSRTIELGSEWEWIWRCHVGSFYWNKRSEFEQKFDGITKWNKHPQLYWNWSNNTQHMHYDVTLQSCFEMRGSKFSKIEERAVLNEFAIIFKDELTLKPFNLMTLYKYNQGTKYTITTKHNAIIGRRDVFDEELSESDLLFDNWVYVCDDEEKGIVNKVWTNKLETFDFESDWSEVSRFNSLLLDELSCSDIVYTKHDDLMKQIEQARNNNKQLDGLSKLSV